MRRTIILLFTIIFSLACEKRVDLLVHNAKVYTSDDNYNDIIKPIALGRVGTCKEIASAILFLCSDLATYISGAILEVTGGKYSTQQ